MVLPVKHRQSILYFAIIMATALLTGSIQIDLPGVYFDSAITDYLATMLVHPQIDNWTGMSIQHMGFPFLGGVYHGSLSVFFQLIILPFAHGSARTLRLPYLIDIGLSGCILYSIIRRLNCNHLFSLLISLTYVTFPAIQTAARTQYDIMLPGNVFFLLSIWFAEGLNSPDKETGEPHAGQSLFLAGTCLGLSFYDYFCFFFFLPTMFLYILAADRSKYRPHFRKFLWGFLIGCSLYICGYLDSFLCNVLGYSTISFTLLIIFCTILYIFLITPVIWIARRTVFPVTLKIIYQVLILLAAGVFTAVLAFAKPLILQKFSLTGNYYVINNATYTLHERLTLFWKYYWSLASGKSAEQMINGKTTSYGAPIATIIMGLFIVAGLIPGFASSTRKKTPAAVMLKWGAASVLVYYILSFPLIARMQPQHFIPVLSMTFILAASASKIIFTPPLCKKLQFLYHCRFC